MSHHLLGSEHKSINKPLCPHPTWIHSCGEDTQWTWHINELHNMLDSLSAKGEKQLN